MSMVVKFMSGEDSPDSDTRKGFRVMSDVVEVRFERSGGDAHAYLTTWCGADGPETHGPIPLEGNVYVLSERGVQLSAFGVAEIPRPAPNPGA